MERYKKIMYTFLASTSLCGLILTSQFSVVNAVDTVSNAAKDPTEVPEPINRSNPKTVAINLVAKEVVAELTPGKQFWFWTFAEKKGDVIGQATVPGPMIRVMEGDTVVINLTNDLGNVEPHNIDFHAGFGAMLEDIAVGQTETLTFKAKREGTYIYHCSGEGMPWEHVAYGMYGLIVVEPKGGLSKVDREFYIAQGDWYIKQGIEPYPDIDGYSLDEDKASEEQPDYYTFNGHTQALADENIYGNAITVNEGESVRVFFVTGGPNKGSNFHIIGQIFDKFCPGHSRTIIRNEETAYVPPGSAATFEFEASGPGDYPIVDHALFRATKGALGYLHVK